MARFRGTVEGNRGPAARLGTPSSGLVTTTNGWDVGVRVDARVIEGVDTLYVYATGGSNDPGGKLIAILRGPPEGTINVYIHEGTTGQSIPKPWRGERYQEEAEAERNDRAAEVQA